MKEINEHQKSLYEKYDIQGSQRYLDRYLPYLEEFSQRETVKILDIGGAGGNFAYLLKLCFEKSAKVEVYVIDSSRYDSWAQEELGGQIRFIHDSVENMDKIFPENTFDLVFANRVFHHLVDRTYGRTLAGMEKTMVMIQKALKPDGMLCVMDHFYNGLLFDGAASRMIYTLTSVKNSIFAKIIKKLGAMTAGVGVCFQSEKMWLSRLEKCGFSIKNVERTKCDKLRFIKKIGLMCKNMSRNNLIFATPENK